MGNRTRDSIFETDLIEFKPLDWKRGEILQLNLTNLARFGKMPGPVRIGPLGPLDHTVPDSRIFVVLILPVKVAGIY